MERNDRIEKIAWRALFTILSICSFAAAIVTLIKCEENEVYGYVFMLPLAHGVISLLCILLYDNVDINIVSLVFIGLYSLRNVLNIMLLAVTDFTIDIANSGPRTLNAAVLLMSVETLIVFISIPWMYKRIMYRQHKIRFRRPGFILSLRNFIFAAAIIFCMLVAIKYPQILSSYTDMFNSSEYIKEINIQEVYGYHRIFTLFRLVFEFIKIMTAALLIDISAKYVKTGILKVVIPLFSLSLFVLFADGSSGMLMTLVVSVLWGIWLSFPGQRKSMFLLFAGTAAVVLWGILAVKGTSARHLPIIDQMSGVLNAYIPGVTAVSDCIDMAFNHSDIIKDTFLRDAFYGWIPFITTSGINFTGHPLSYYFNAYYTQGSQIVPCIGHCYFYLRGFAIIPLLVYIYAAHYSYKKAKYADNSYRKIIWLFLGVHLARTFTMMNISNSLGTITKFFALLWVLSLFSADRQESVNKRQKNIYV